MKKVIHIYGASGSGTSTLGKALVESYNYMQMDTDDYFWKPTNPPFIEKREQQERIELMQRDIIANEKIAITGSLCGWGNILIPFFDLAIRIVTPTDIRIKRLEEREYQRFGDRVKIGGDMYEEHLKFIEWASEYDNGDEKMRSGAMHDSWSKLLMCKQLTLDGSESISGNLKLICHHFQI